MGVAGADQTAKGGSRLHHSLGLPEQLERIEALPFVEAV